MCCAQGDEGYTLRAGHATGHDGNPHEREKEGYVEVIVVHGADSEEKE
jgi:hypothetical protein